ncbi:MAG: hypothetical protein ACE5FL_12790 [Myxococcota bacterium]
MALIFLTLLFKHISYPLIWHDESDTVMFAQRVVEYGYPKVHADKNVVYGLRLTQDRRIDTGLDAYTGAPWGYYYFGAIGVALAAGFDDVYTKTALLRLPFAAIGAAGLLVLLLGVLDAVSAEPRRRAAFAIAFWSLSAYSVALILHLREARYYGLFTFLTCALLAVYLRYHVHRKGTFGAYAALLTLLLFGVFNTFYPAYPVFLAAMGLHQLGGAVAGREAAPARRDGFLRGVFPLALSLLLVLPLLFYFDFLIQVRDWTEAESGSLQRYASHIDIVLRNLLRYEFLAPALVARLGVVLLRALRPARSVSAHELQRRQLSAFLALFIAVYAVIVSTAHVVWDRYFIALSPVVTVLFLLDATTLWEWLRDPSFGRRRSARAMAAIVAACFVASCWIRAPEFRDRLYEITHPYRGPLDFVIPYLKEKYSKPEDLVIATNYEDPVFMYYLGSRVTVGYYGANLEWDMQYQPDVIVPRPWKRHRRMLRQLAARAEYEHVVFPVKDQRTNNTPGLSALNPGEVSHRFRTLLAEKGERKLAILVRPIGSR